MKLAILSTAVRWKGSLSVLRDQLYKVFCVTVVCVVFLFLVSLIFHLFNDKLRLPLS